MISLKVYICTTHDRFYPVGAASVIVARDETEARKLLDAALAEKGLKTSKEDDYELVAMDLSTPAAHILNDGNY